MADMQQRLLDIFNEAPAGENGYRYAGSHAAWLFVSRGPPMLPVTVVINVIYVLSIIACSTLIWQRSRRKGMVRSLSISKLISSEETSIGTFYVPHTLNCTLLANLAFCCCGIPTSWQGYLFQKTGDLTYWNGLIMCSGTIFITLILVPWCDLSVLAVSALDFQRMSTSLSALKPPTWAKYWLASLVNTVFFVVPAAVLVLALSLFLANYFVSMRPMLAQSYVIRDLLYSYEGQWTGSVTLDDMAPFADVLADCYEKANYTAYWYRIGYGMWLAAVVLLYAIWIPLIIRYKYIVNWQISQLKEAAGTLASHRIRVQELDGNQSASRQPRMSTENKVRALIAVVKFRVFLLACLSMALASYLVILCLVLKWSNTLVVDSYHLFGTDTAAIYSFIWSIVPAVVAATLGQTEISKTDPALVTTQFSAWRTDHDQVKLRAFTHEPVDELDDSDTKPSSRYRGIEISTHRHIVFDPPPKDAHDDV